MNLLGLIPVLVGTGVGADMAKRIAAPIWGGLITLTMLTLFVIPSLYVVWRSAARRRKAHSVPSLAVDDPRIDGSVMRPALPRAVETDASRRAKA